MKVVDVIWMVMIMPNGHMGWGPAKKRADKLHSRQNLDIVDSSGTGQQN